MFYFEPQIKEKVGKFDSKTDIDIFLGYSCTGKAYKIFNRRTLVIEESMPVMFNDSCNNISDESL